MTESAPLEKEPAWRHAQAQAPTPQPAASNDLQRSVKVYGYNSAATGGAAPYRFTVTSGSLPDGCFLSTSGILSGTPRVAKLFTFTVQATDADGVSGSRSYTLAITAPTVSLSPTFLPGFSSEGAPGTGIPGPAGWNPPCGGTPG